MSKFFILVVIVIIFAACSGTRQSNKAAPPDPAKVERRRQTAAKNEVTELTKTAQTLEKTGRQMENYRVLTDAPSVKECHRQAEQNQTAVTDLETKINVLPSPYLTQMQPIIADLNDCVSCSKTAMASCVKSRASINQAIKEIYP